MLAMPSKINNRLRTAVWAAPLLSLIALATATGCAGKTSKWKPSNWDVKKAVGMKPDKPDPELPERMVATWTDTTLSTVGQSPKRGFGGKLMFFKRGSEDPVRVEGNLVVYAFDETDRPDHETQPTRRYIFPIEEFVLHESDSTLGPTYSFWLPWDEIGGQQRHISLIAKFEPKKGAVVIGEQTRHLLPGLTNDPNADKPLLAKTVQTENGEQVRLAAYSGQAAATVTPGAVEHSVVAPTPQREMSTATIPLPKRLSEAAAKEQTTTFGKSSSATPLSQLSTMKSESAPAAVAPAAAATSQVVQASANMPVAPAATVTTATQRKAMIEAAKAPSAAPGSLRDSLLQTLPAQARQSGR
ncbi:MAG: hypothetical protein C0485_07215 [Pirellula sp.]|nr:hypothetical protein [Pirellula sp.]